MIQTHFRNKIAKMTSMTTAVLPNAKRLNITVNTNAIINLIELTAVERQNIQIQTLLRWHDFL